MDPHAHGLTRAKETADAFRRNLRTVILGTCSAEGEPDASVSPAWLDADGSILVYVSSLALHTRNLLQTRRASVLVIEDEANATQVLARRRLTLVCRAEPVPRDTPAHAAAMSGFRVTFGRIMEELEALPDFQLVRLFAERGRLVVGFGQAFAVDPRDWSPLSRVGGPGGARPPA
jgi:putative heme iron utilization protein